MPTSIDFRSCPACGKSVRSDSRRCHRCGKSIELRQEANEPLDDAEHSAVYGGYDPTQDEFDYQEFVEEEFGNPSGSARRRPWFWYVAWLMVFVMAFPLVLTLVQLINTWEK